MTKAQLKKSVCIVIATLNVQRTLRRCLESIFWQDYPKKEVIIVDGGSTDKTVEIAKKYKTRIIIKKGLSSEAAKAVGLKATKADIYCDMAADNYLPERGFIKKMMEPINIKSKIKNQKSKTQVKSQKFDIVGSYPERYYYDKHDSLLNRYFALFGVNDPVALYLNKQDRMEYMDDKGNEGYRIEEFDEENMPTLGANGFFIERKLLLRADLKNFYHIDAIYDLIKKYGILKFAVVNAAIGHDTGENLWSFLKKRRRYFENLYLKNYEKRRYRLYDKNKDLVKLAKFVLFAVTFVEPTLRALKGYLKIRDKSWFMHPLVCFLTVINYGFSYCSHKK